MADELASGKGPQEAPCIAVIIPCFNDGSTLRDAVRSITSDSLPLELVIVDDGSTDQATVDLLADMDREGFRVIHQSNQGPSAATEAGLGATSAEYVMRIDADDLLEAGALERLADALDASPTAALAWGDVKTFGASTFVIFGVRGLDPWLLTYTNCITGAGTLFRRSAIMKSGGWKLRDGYEDWDLFMALAELGLAGIYVPGIVFRYRRDSSGRHVGSLPLAGEYYEELRERHQRLFAARRANRRSSSVPWVMKVLVSAIEALPGLSRLTRIQLCELVARLWWGGGLRGTAPMILQAAVRRLRLEGRINWKQASST